MLHIPVDFGETEPIPTQIDPFYTGPCRILFDDEIRGTRVRKEIREIALQVNKSLTDSSLLDILVVKPKRGKSKFFEIVVTY